MSGLVRNRFILREKDSNKKSQKKKDAGQQEWAVVSRQEQTRKQQVL